MLKAFIFVLLAGIIFSLVHCSQENPLHNRTSYLNLQDSVQYMGGQTCRSCHSEIHNDFMQTGMGKSFHLASQEKTAASYGVHDLVYDEKSNFYYKPYFENGSMYIKEFRLSGKDTIHSRVEKIAYIVGSGQHTNSHILNENGYIFQAPITYYTQDKKWDMAPGFEEINLRFSRTLEAECLTCHNHFPKKVEGSFHKFEEMPTGIECERCHGPGEIHVKEKLAGKLVDTANYIDYSIVNPRDLSRNLQMDLCQRCHLQGLSVLNEGKSFYDFKPGMELSSVFNVYLPRYENSHDKFIMASQADRLKLSPCFMNSQELTCLSCHHPHHSIEKTDQSQYINACLSCHTKEKNYCSIPKEIRLKESDNCISCHMQKSGSTDIPHVEITDHFISKLTSKKDVVINKKSQKDIAKFLGLDILTKKNASDFEMANAYIAMHDKYVQAEVILDSALYYLKKINKEEEHYKSWIHYYFAKENYDDIIRLGTKVGYANIKDHWTLYRIGEAFLKHEDYDNALPFLYKATQLQPYDLDFQEKFGMANLQLGRLETAREIFEFVLTENPKRKVSQNNYGFLLSISKEMDKAELHYRKAIALDPDYKQALINLNDVLIQKKEVKESKLILKRIEALSNLD